MFCPNCGAESAGKFCEKCGTAVHPGAATGGSAPPVFTAGGLQMNIVSALCYIVPVIGPLLFLLIDPYKRDRTVRFAAFQSLLLSLAVFVINQVLAFTLGSVSDLSFSMYRLLHLLEFILVLFLAFKAFQNEKIVLPGIGPLAQKQV